VIVKSLGKTLIQLSFRGTRNLVHGSNKSRALNPRDCLTQFIISIGQTPKEGSSLHSE